MIVLYLKNSLIEDVLPVYRRCKKEELKICPGDWKYGSFFSTLVTECDLYLPWATKKFHNAGGNMYNKKIDNFNELYGSYDIVVNCTGLGAKYLCNDRKLVPIRGQVLKVDAPWIKMAYYADYDTYIVPGFSGITLGGCRNFESFDMKPSKYDTESITERCQSLVPSLKSGKLKEIKVGLRPHRDPVRVEYEFLETSRGIMKIVHQYGHGGKKNL
jgi:D-aspartate oxidase